RHLQEASPATLIATAKAIDPEMIARIERHKAERPAHIQTLETNTGIGPELRALSGGMALIECMGTWVTNRMWDLGLDFDDPGKEQADQVYQTILCEARDILDSASASEAEVWLVTNEVGWGLMPQNPIGRLFTDTLGRVNQMIAQAAGEVYLVCSSIPIRIK
ncbi:MAG: bifunctional adenosylcobinamide kinase/adenosylcobinamide-phosphate guanylyltransferase, partial [Bacillota bacterium]